MPPTTIRTLGDLLRRLGDVPPVRIRFHPPPGTAKVQDVLDVKAREGRICELIDGVLVEKAAGFLESSLSAHIGSLLLAHVLPRNLGVVTGAFGAVQLMPNLVRIPDVAYSSWDRLPGRRLPTDPVPLLAPDLVVHVLRRSNTPGELTVRRQHYFTAGVRLVWEVDPVTRTVMVWTSPSDVTTLAVGETLDGGTVLPGFQLSLTELFEELDRHG